MPAPMTRGSHLVDRDEWEQRQEDEKAARIKRFAQGAHQIERAMGPMPQSGPSMREAYDREVSGAAHQVDMEALDAQFTALNQRFSE